MSTNEEMLEQLAAIKKTRSLNTLIAQADFNRLAVAHFADNVMPELKRFEDCLRHQGVRINLLSESRSSIRATMAIEQPTNTYNLLVICYDFASRALVFETVLGGNDRETHERYPVAQLGEVTPALVYEIFEEFVQTIFNSESLCEFHDETESDTPEK